MDSNSLAERIEKRTREIKKFLDDFIASWNSVEYYPKIKAIDNAPLIIATIYFEINNTNVKGVYLREDGFTNRFKVASLTEISSMLLSPLRFVDLSYPQTETGLIKINARLATTLALSMLNAIHHEKFKVYLPKAKDERIKSAIGSHTYWVRYFIGDDNAYPILLNSTFWEMYVSALLLEK